MTRRALNTHADLLQLIADKIPEGTQLEYKREFPSPGDGGAIAILKSLTALANTHGGTLIYGIDAKHGLPLDLAPIPDALHDALLLRLDNLCRDGVQPRLQRIDAKFVAIPGGGVLVIDVPRSLQRPHRAIAGGHGHFYGRQSASLVQLDVAQLRSAFTAGEALTERIRSFRADRLLSIAAGDTPVPLASFPARVVLHLIPMASFESDITVDLTAQHQAVMQCQPIGGDAAHNLTRINLDGRLIYSNLPAGGCVEYVQVYRDGRLEVVRTIQRMQMDRSRASEWHAEFDEQLILQALTKYWEVMQRLGVPAPAVLMLSFLGMKACTMTIDRQFWMRRDDRFDRDALVLPEIVVEDWNSDPATLLKGTFDLLWNAYGMERSENYDDAGQWVGQSERK